MSPRPEVSILILHDSPSFCSLLSGMLRRLGHHSIQAFDDGEVAMLYLRANTVDLVLVDGELQGGLAFKFAQAFRIDRKTRRRTLPLVLLTPDCHTKGLQHAVRSGFDAVIPKPIGSNLLQQEIVRTQLKPRVYVHVRDGYCGPDRRRRIDGEFSGDDRRNGGSFQVVSKDGVVSLDQLERLQNAGTGDVDLEVLLLRGNRILAGYRLNAHAAHAEARPRERSARSGEREPDADALATTAP